MSALTESIRISQALSRLMLSRGWSELPFGEALAYRREAQRARKISDLRPKLRELLGL